MNDNLPIIKICGKCGASFSCNANEIEKCFCNEIPLSETAKKEIGENYSDCLCEDCLKELKKTSN